MPSRTCLLLVNIGQLLTLRSSANGARRGASLSDLGTIHDAAVLCVGGKIVSVGSTKDALRDPWLKKNRMVVDGERQKVAVIHRRGHAGGGENNGVAVARDNGAIGLFRNFSSFESQGAPADFDRDAMWCGSVRVFRHNHFLWPRIRAEHLRARSRGKRALSLRWPQCGHPR